MVKIGNFLQRSVGAVLSLCCVGAAWAEDYELAAGATDTISTNVNYATMSILGDLTVNNNAKVMNLSAATVNLNGTVKVTGAQSVFGHSGSGSAFVLNVNQNADGSYGKAVVENGTAAEFGGYENLCARVLNVKTNAVAASSGDDCIDFLELRGGSLQSAGVYNYSTLTARITVVGSNLIMKNKGYCYGAGIFRKGNFRIELTDGAALTFAAGNQLAAFNDANVGVRTVGSGTVIFSQTFNQNQTYTIRNGARFDHKGELRFGTYNDPQVYEFATSDAIGPGITKLRAMYTGCRLMVGRNVTLTVPDVDFSTNGSGVTGAGKINIDCSTKPRRFIANPYSAAEQLTFIKTGAYEATVVSTNLLRTWVKEGTLRLTTKNCTINDLRVEPGAELVVDGITLTLNLPETLLLPAVRCENGGRIVLAGEGAAMLYSPSLSGPIQVAGGAVDCSRAGIDAKYWRFVFKGHKTKPAPLTLRNIFLFGEAHELENWGLGNANPTRVTDDSTEALPAGQIRFRYNSATNILSTGKSDWQNLDKVYRYTSSAYNGNNYPALTAPVINLEDPTSWVTVEMHLKDTARPITSYNIGVVDGRSNNHLDCWDVYASVDGMDWTLVDSRSGVTLDDTAGDYRTFDGWDFVSQLMGKDAVWLSANVRDYFLLNHYAQDGLSASSAIQLEVVEDASIALTNFTAAAQTIDGLVYDGTRGGGTIYGGALAGAGRIDLTNFDVYTKDDFALRLDGTAGTANLANWAVYANGAALPGCAPSYDAETGRIHLNCSVVFLHVSETETAGDLHGTYPNKDIYLEIDNGVVYTNTTALTGARMIAKTGAGRLVLTQESSAYAGEIQLLNGVLDGQNVASNAFGTGTVRVAGTTTGICRMILGSTTMNTVYDNDIVLEGSSGAGDHSTLFIITAGQKKTTLNGDIAASGDFQVMDSKSGNSQNWTLVTFNGTVAAPGYGVYYPCDNNVCWKGAISADMFRCASGYPGMGAHFFYSSENRIGVIDVTYNAVCAMADGAFGGAVLKFTESDSADDSGRGAIKLNGRNQTVAYLTCTSPGATYSRAYDFDINTPSTLTLTGGVATALVHGRLGRPNNNKNYGKLSLVVAAGNDDFTQIFTNSVGTTYGTVTTENGTLRFAGTSILTNCPALTVNGGRLEIESTTSQAFFGVTNITIGATGTLKVAAEATEPFDLAKKPTLDLAAGAALELPEGAFVQVNKAFRDGRPVPSGTYTGVGAGSGKVTEASWIVGSGRLFVQAGSGTLLLIR